LRHVRQEAERGAILRALSMTDNNISAAAKLLGVTRPTFYDLIKKYDMSQQCLINGSDAVNGDKDD
jgi:two-component system NtrC family response regulator